MAEGLRFMSLGAGVGLGALWIGIITLVVTVLLKLWPSKPHEGPCKYAGDIKLIKKAILGNGQKGLVRITEQALEKTFNNEKQIAAAFRLINKLLEHLKID